MKSIFPDPNLATEEGLLTVGGFITPEILIDAYSNGIFPWPVSVDLPLAWFSPDPRGVIDLGEFNPSKSLIKSIKQSDFEFSFNRNFEQVIKKCAKHHSRNFSEETWITPEIIEGYISLFKYGNAYSAEAYLDGELVGGLYGVHIGRYFSGESMFYEKDNASKFALMELLKILKKKSHSFFDTQMVTPITERFGAKEIPRKEFLSLLYKERDKKTSLVF